MQQNKREYYRLSEISALLKDFGRHIRSKWFKLLFAAAIGAGLGIAYFFFQQPRYESVSTFILEEKSAGGGGLAGLASQFGFDLGSMGGGGNLFAGDNILDILTSKKIVQEVLLSPAGDHPQSPSLAALYLDFSGLKKKWKNKPGLADISFSPKTAVLTPLQDSVIAVIHEAMGKKHLHVERTSKQGSIIKVQVSAPDNQFARLMTGRLVESASRLYTTIKTGTAEANIEKLQKRSDSLLVLLNRKSFTAAASQPLDINPALKTAAVPTEIASRDKTVIATIYAEVTKNLEASKMLLSQQTPVVQVLDSPALLLDDNRKSLPLLVVIAAMVTGAIYLAVLFLSFIVKAKHSE